MGIIIQDSDMPLDDIYLNAVKDTVRELQSALAKWPQQVIDPMHASGITAEEIFESMFELSRIGVKISSAAHDANYDNGDWQNMRTELAQSAATILRIMANLDKFQPTQTYEPLPDGDQANRQAGPFPPASEQ